MAGRDAGRIKIGGELMVGRSGDRKNQKSHYGVQEIRCNVPGQLPWITAVTPFACCLRLFFHMKIRLRLAFLTVNAHNAVCIGNSKVNLFETIHGSPRVKWNDTIERTFSGFFASPRDSSLAGKEADCFPLRIFIPFLISCK
jgi:hypothetical protein